MENAIVIRDTKANRVMNAISNTTNHFAMTPNYCVRIVITLVISVDAIRPVRKAVVFANVVGQCNQIWAVVWTLMNVQRLSTLARKINFV